MKIEDLRVAVASTAYMSKSELIAYRDEVAVSLVDTKAKDFIMKAIDLHLKANPLEDSVVVNGDIDTEGF